MRNTFIVILSMFIGLVSVVPVYAEVDNADNKDTKQNKELIEIHQISQNTAEFRKLNTKQRDITQEKYHQARITERNKDIQSNNEKLDTYKRQIEHILDGTVDELILDLTESDLETIKEDSNLTEYEQELIIQKVKDNKDAIIKITDPDPRYTGYTIYLPPDQRDLLERLVTGEAGGSYEGSLLVAQCIRDAIVCDGYKSISEIRKSLKYSGSIYRGITEHAKQAVADIFDKGINAVQHRIYYFYAPALVYSSWHETQKFILEKNGHRYFDRITDTDNNKTLDGSKRIILLESAPIEDDEYTPYTNDSIGNNGDGAELPDNPDGNLAIEVNESIQPVNLDSLDSLSGDSTVEYNKENQKQNDTIDIIENSTIETSTTEDMTAEISTEPDTTDTSVISTNNLDDVDNSDNTDNTKDIVKETNIEIEDIKIKESTEQDIIDTQLTQNIGETMNQSDNLSSEHNNLNNYNEEEVSEEWTE